MKKVMIIGAGAQGGPCASILARDDEIEHIILGDIDLDLCKKVKKKIGSDKIEIVKINAANLAEIEHNARSVDAIINLVIPLFNKNIMRVALKVGAHYVDTSFGEPELLDICERDNILSQIIENRPLMLDNEFKEAGLTALVGCGGTPGFTNVCIRHVCDKLDRVSEIKMKLGDGPKPLADTVPEKWNPGWSPFRALWGYAVKPAIFRQGAYDQCRVFDEPETYRFPDPIGEILIAQHQHQEQVTLPYFIGKGIQHCEYKYPVDPQAATFVKMGFGNPDKIKVADNWISPRDVLLSLTPAPGNMFLEENEKTASAPLVHNSIWVTDISGEKDGMPMHYKIAAPYTFFLTTEEKQSIFKKFGTTDIGVAMPAIVGAKMCVSGDAEKGVISPECVDPHRFFELIRAANVPLSLNETVIHATD